MVGIEYELPIHSIAIVGALLSTIGMGLHKTDGDYYERNQYAFLGTCTILGALISILFAVMSGTISSMDPNIATGIGIISIIIIILTLLAIMIPFIRSIKNHFAGRSPIIFK